jgi:hypothetical protein
MKASAMPLYQRAAPASEQAMFRQRRIMESYSFSLARGKGRVRDMILRDIRRFSDLGACRHVLDLSEVLKQFELANPATPASGG